MTKEDFLKRLDELKINKIEFAEICKVPYPTVNNWGVMKNGKPLPIPYWVEPFLEFYEKSKKFDYIANEICAKMQKIV